MNAEQTNAELFFIYDSHCPWSYATTHLINEIATQLPKITLHFLHNAFYSRQNFDDDNVITTQQINDVKQTSSAEFSTAYLNKLSVSKDSTLCANLLAWCNHKAHKKTLELLNAIQKAHFITGEELNTKEQLQLIIDRLKLSPPTKAFAQNKLTKEAEFDLQEIFEIQSLIQTKAIPVLLLAVKDNLILLKHNFYLEKPRAIVDAIKIELKNID